MGYCVALDGYHTFVFLVVYSVQLLIVATEATYSNWTKLNVKLKAHSVSPIHTKCALDMKSFKEAHSGVHSPQLMCHLIHVDKNYMTATVIGLILSLNMCCSVGSKTLLFEGMMMQIL